MSEWQPARLRKVHARKPVQHLLGTPMDGLIKKVFRVREADSDLLLLGIDLYRKMGCGAMKFFIVHPDDVDGRAVCACEHEILTD
jgi:hypothetical protein